MIVILSYKTDCNVHDFKVKENTQKKYHYVIDCIIVALTVFYVRRGDEYHAYSKTAHTNVGKHNLVLVDVDVSYYGEVTKSNECIKVDFIRP